jgi:hypothetical protein
MPTEDSFLAHDAVKQTLDAVLHDGFYDGITIRTSSQTLRTSCAHSFRHHLRDGKTIYDIDQH